MNRKEARKQILQIFTNWKKLQDQEENVLCARQVLIDHLPAMFQSMADVLRSIESADEVDLGADTALRIVQISARLYQKYPWTIEVAGVERVHSQIQFALEEYIRGMRPVHSIERLGLKNHYLEERALQEGLTTVGALISFLKEGGRFHRLRSSQVDLIIRAVQRYLAGTPNVLVTLPVESEMDLPDEVEEADARPPKTGENQEAE